MYSKLKAYIQDLEADLSNIPDNRSTKLKALAEYIRSKNPVNLTFICTHNSRRSHLCQIWAATLAHYFDVKQVQTYSGGTEATAFNPHAVAAIERAGFKVKNPGGTNPGYEVYFDDEYEPLICFSKRFNDSHNPKKGFAAIMTCSHADQNCPLVPGAEKRFSIPYVDPKESDGTPKETQVYDDRCRQIAAEMCYVMSLAK